MKKVLIINSNYYKKISENLYIQARNQLNDNKIKSSVIYVPGVFEIPVTIKKYVKKFDAFLALGCVIKGETPHFDLICQSTFDAFMKISIDYSKPIGNGIITCLNMKQALARSVNSKNFSKANKGLEAAKAVISIFRNEPKNT